MSQSDEVRHDDRLTIVYWWLRHAIIPVGIAVIAGGFALAVAVMVSYGEVEITSMQITRDFEILATEMAVNGAGEVSDPASGPEQPAGTVTPTLTAPPPPPTVPPPPPTVPPPAPAVYPCGQVPNGWELYQIRQGDTLFSLARRTGTTVATVQRANCLPDARIYFGRSIWLPPVVAPVVVAPPTDAPTEESTRVVTVTVTEESTRVVVEPEVTVGPESNGGVSVIGVSTADGSGRPKSTFQPGDVIQWIITVENATGREARFDLTFEALGPNRQRTTLWNGSVLTDAGVKSWDYTSKVTEEMLGLNSFWGYGLDNNLPSQANVTYQVTQPVTSPEETPTAEGPG